MRQNDTGCHGSSDDFSWCNNVVHPTTTFDKNAILTLNPHYTDNRFNEKVKWKAQTIFGSPDESGLGHSGLNYDYSDRLQQWNYTKSEQAWKAAIDSGHEPKTANFIEAYLSFYYDKPIEVVHILAGVNCSNGFPYWVVGYREKKKEAKQSR